MRRQAADAAELAEPRRPGRDRARDRHPVVVFVERRHVAAHVEAPQLVGGVVEAQLRKRNPQLRGPALLGDVGARLPHRIEAFVEGGFVVFGMKPIDADARRGDAEHVRRAPIVKGVERDLDVLGLFDAVAPAHRRLDRRPRRLVHPRADVQRRRVVDEADLHPLGRRRALHRFLLDEVVDPRRLLPQRLVEPAVHADACLRRRESPSRAWARGGGVLGQRPGRGRERRGERDGGGNRVKVTKGMTGPDRRDRAAGVVIREQARGHRGRAMRHDAVCLRNQRERGRTSGAVATARGARTRRPCSPSAPRVDKAVRSGNRFRGGCRRMSRGRLPRTEPRIGWLDAYDETSRSGLSSSSATVVAAPDAQSPSVARCPSRP